MEQIKKKRIMWLLIFLATVLLYVSSMVLGWLFIPLSTDIKLSIVLVLTIIFIGVFLWFKPRIVYYATVYQWFRLKEGQEPTKRIDLDISTTLIQTLEEKSFKTIKNTDTLSLSYRYLKSHQLETKRGSLEAVVYIKDEKITFNDQQIHRIINQIEETLKTEKKRFLNYVIIQFKAVKEITPDLINEANQVAFDKHSAVRVSIINALYQKDTQEIYYLHNKTYSPNFHYTYAISLLESLLS